MSITKEKAGFLKLLKHLEKKTTADHTVSVFWAILGTNQVWILENLWNDLVKLLGGSLTNADWL